MTDAPVRNAPGRVAGGVLDPDLGRLTMSDRVARGKAARAELPRESHAMFDPPADRPDPVALLEQQAESRVPELVPIRYGRMLVSPFAYFRGAALPMASDLADTRRSASWPVRDWKFSMDIDRIRPAWRSTASCARGPWPGRTPGPVIASG
jgi:Uncharacterized protein conserved in bacteria (DUF2252)